MTIYVNGRFLTQPASGVQRYAAQILTCLDRRAADGMAPPIELLCPPGAPAVSLVAIRQRFVGRGGGHRWEQWDFTRAAQDGVALSLAMSGPLRHRRHLVVIHDAAVHRHPEHFSMVYAAGHRLLDHWLARRAAIATVSHFSRSELAAVLGLRAESIAVAPNGADHVEQRSTAGIPDHLDLGGRRFFLVLGNLAPNKNLAVIDRALAHVGDHEVRVIVVGAGRGRVFGAPPMPRDSRLRFAGRLSDGEVGALMAEARALIFPSRYEGFGLPPLEAMASGCPVLASDIGAVREVCGAAADLFEPDDEWTLARLMRRALVDDGPWRAARIAAGRARAGLFGWTQSADVILRRCVELDEERGATCGS